MARSRGCPAQSGLKGRTQGCVVGEVDFALVVQVVLLHEREQVLLLDVEGQRLENGLQFVVVWSAHR